MEFKFCLSEALVGKKWFGKFRLIVYALRRNVHSGLGKYLTL
jgi:hypothetical protein